MLVIFFYIAIIIVVVLAGIAVYYHFKLYAQLKKREEYQKQVQIERSEMQSRTKKSIELLCRALLADQVLITEAAIRISVLINVLELHENEMQRYGAFTHLANAVAHIPILEDWRQLSRKQQQDYENERENIENQYRDFIIDAAQAYLNRSEYLGANSG